MTTLTFDTHKAVKALKDAGAEERLAEAVVATVGDAVGGNVATKADLEPLATKADLYRALLTTALATVAATVALVKLLP